MKTNSTVKAHTKGTLYALVTTLAAVLIFALFIKWIGIGSGAIKAIVQIIKVASIFLGVMIVLKNVEKRAWLHGGILGLIYTVLAFFIFSIIDNNFSITAGFFIDALFALAIGVLSAMLIRFRKRDI